MTFDQPIGKATIYLPNDSVSPIAQHDVPTQLTLDVPDRLLVLELKPDSGFSGDNQYVSSQFIGSDRSNQHLVKGAYQHDGLKLRTNRGCVSRPC